MHRIVAAAGFFLALISPEGATFAAEPAPQSAAMFEEVRQADMTLATIGWRLASSNVALCDRQEPGLVMQIHTLDQF